MHTIITDIGISVTPIEAPWFVLWEELITNVGILFTPTVSLACFVRGIPDSTGPVV